MKRILISVPHAKCDIGSYISTEENRFCDLRAESAANIIKEELENSGSFEKVEMTVSNLFRPHIDGNRYISRNTKWRRTLSSAMEECDFLIDAHSFPDKFIPDKKIYIVVDKDLHKLLKDYFPSDLITLSTPKNDIISEAGERGINAILIEFNEDSDSLADEEIRKFAKSLIPLIENAPNRKKIRVDSIKLIIMISTISIIIVFVIITEFYSTDNRLGRLLSA